VAGDAVQPAEAESAVGDVQPCRLFGQRAHLDVACHERAAVHAVHRSPERVAVPALHTRALGVQPYVQPVDVALLGAQLVVIVLS
jgi:hypothetical protein